MAQPKKQIKKAEAAKIVKPKKESIPFPWIAVGVVFVLTILAYLPAFKAEFVIWDDDEYVLGNTLIRSFSNFKEMLVVPFQGNHHPLTLLSLAFNYSISGLEPWSYHLFNIILHLLNIYLVYLFTSRLSKENKIISVTTALLFAIHPMHVESVAWVSERKDVLYGFFFLLGLISYLKYVDAEKSYNKQKNLGSYSLSILWLLLSLASKPAAVIFPLALFTIDFLRKRQLSLKLILEKIPHLVLGAVFGWLTLHAQQTLGATQGVTIFNVGTKLLFSFYGYMMYFIKMIFPVGLATFYPFPALNESLPVAYYIAPVFFLVTVVACVFTWKKYPEITFGFAFYLINLLLILQFVVVGSAIIADRYTYIPYIGLFYIIGWLLDKGQKKISISPYIPLGIVGLLLSVVTYRQVDTWSNSHALWDNAIKNCPSATAYSQRGRLARDEGDSDKAFAYFNEAIKLNKESAGAFCSRGAIYFERNQDSLALLDYNYALSLNPNDAPTLSNRASLYGKQQKHDLALIDLRKALKIKPDYPLAVQTYAFESFMTNDFQTAKIYFEKSIAQNPSNAQFYYGLGLCYQRLGKDILAIEPFTKAIELSQNPSYYLLRSHSYFASGNIEAARRDALQAQLKVPVPPEYLAQLGI